MPRPLLAAAAALVAAALALVVARTRAPVAAAQPAAAEPQPGVASAAQPAAAEPQPAAAEPQPGAVAAAQHVAAVGGGAGGLGQPPVGGPVSSLQGMPEAVMDCILDGLSARGVLSLCLACLSFRRLLQARQQPNAPRLRLDFAGDDCTTVADVRLVLLGLLRFVRCGSLCPSLSATTCPTTCCGGRRGPSARGWSICGCRSRGARR